MAMGLRKSFKKAINLRGNAHQCYVCGATFSRFLPYRQAVVEQTPFLNALGLIGSDLQNFSCPVCRCADRDRHLCMYLDALNLWPRFADARVLHFAPEAAIVPRIKAVRPAQYVQADLFPTSADIEKIDITNIPYPDNHFDLVICNHVLEHVPDDDLALSEMRRVLKPAGCAILQTPYSSVLHATWSDAGITSEAQRLMAYGQEDHVRLYGMDFFEKISAAGLLLRRQAHRDLLANFDPRYYGVNQQEDLILAEKLS
jgi:SAM-dependent methyltransferase